MSTIKNPKEKKRLSLERERRNRFGENSKSSRKNISRNKQLRHIDERRTADEVLGRLNGQVSEDQAIEAEFIVRTRAAEDEASKSNRTSLSG